MTSLLRLIEATPRMGIIQGHDEQAPSCPTEKLAGTDAGSFATCETIVSTPGAWSGARLWVMHDDDSSRIGETERQVVVNLLSCHLAGGRFTLEEFAERATRVYAARTRDDLDGLVEDQSADPPEALRGRSAAPTEHRVADTTPRMASPRPTPPTRRRFIAILSGASARERWSAARRISAIALFGGVKIDLRRAVIDSPVVDITAWSISGSVAVVVPARIPVELDGLVLMGTSSNRAETEPIPGAPLIRVHARGLLGGVTVRTGRQRRHGGKVDGREPERGGVDRHRGTLTMLVTDIVGSTQLAEQLGDQQWMEVLQTHNRLVRHEVTGRGGTEVKTLGDSFLVVFPSARQAILAAIAVQKAITAYRAEHSDHPVELRIGLHTGEVVEADDDVHGQNVVIAVRIANAAPAGEILVSGVTRDLTVSSGDLQFDDADDIALKGVSEPWRVYRVCWE